MFVCLSVRREGLAFFGIYFWICFFWNNISVCDRCVGVCVRCSIRGCTSLTRLTRIYRYIDYRYLSPSHLPSLPPSYIFNTHTHTHTCTIHSAASGKNQGPEHVEIHLLPYQMYVCTRVRTYICMSGEIMARRASKLTWCHTINLMPHPMYVCTYVRMFVCWMWNDVGSEAHRNQLVATPNVWVYARTYVRTAVVCLDVKRG